MIKFTQSSDNLSEMRTDCVTCHAQSSGFHFRDDADGRATMERYVQQFFVELAPAPDGTRRVACGVLCAERSKNERNPFTLSGDELTKLTAGGTSFEHRERAALAANPDVSARCAHCGEVATTARATAEENLAARGWHKLPGGTRACSATCLTWLRRPEPPPVAIPQVSETMRAQSRSNAVTRKNAAEAEDTAAGPRLESRGL